MATVTRRAACALGEVLSLHTKPHVTGKPETPPGTVRPTNFLVTEVAASALDCSVGDYYRSALGAVGDLGESAAQLRAVRLLGRGVLTADIAAVQAVERAIVGRCDDDRVRIISTLGELSAAAGQAANSTLEPLIRSAARECNLALSLVHTARNATSNRQTNHNFVRWVTLDPAGFTRWVWTASLRAAGERIWDRSWTQIADHLDGASWNRISLARPRDRRSGWRPFDESAIAARKAAVDALVDTALSGDPSRMMRGWPDAMEKAEKARGSLTWARFANEIRSEIGPTTWATTNRVLSDQVAVVIKDLPWIAGYVGMIALACEAATAPVRSAVVNVGAQAMARFTDVDEALEAAIAGSADVIRLSA